MELLFVRNSTRLALGAGIAIILISLRPASAAEPITYAAVPELKKLSLEELVETPVISASRVPESWFIAPTAIDLMTEEEIRRSGVVRLPELLRYVTGVEVARFAGNSYAISARGFNGVAANKLQVMMDGRSLYTPLLSGVFWEIQDTLLEDLDRIEVVRGPGATLWGANAVNGVINIISKSARDTQGTLIMGGAGNEERFFTGVRYGGQISENSFYRVYVKQYQVDDKALRNGSDASDSVRQTQAGFRSDSYFLDTDQLTVQGDGYFNESESQGRDDAEHKGGNFLARWNRSLAEYGDVTVQSYYDRGVRDVPLQFYEDRQTFDIDAQHHFNWLKRNNLVWGVAYRASWDKTGEHNRTVQFDPAERTIHLVSGFVQDEITVIEDLLKLTLGTKLEENSFTGFEVQPSGRFTITPNEKHTIWGAVSRAVRSPTRAEDDIRFSSSPSGTPLIVKGNHAFVSEELLAYEVGYRAQVAKRLSVDVAGFYNDYQNLRTQEPSPRTVFPFIIMNERHGETYGGEIALKLQVTDWARISASYSRIEEDLRFSRKSKDPTGGSAEGNDPRDFAVLHLALDLPQNIEFDIFGRYMDALPNPKVPSYFTLDVRLGWRPTKNLEISIVGQNLTDPQHREFGAPTFPEVERSVFAKATLRF
jgi:iron complex outermembrane recepter protein